MHLSMRKSYILMLSTEDHQGCEAQWMYCRNEVLMRIHLNYCWRRSEDELAFVVINTDFGSTCSYRFEAAVL